MAKTDNNTKNDNEKSAGLDSSLTTTNNTLADALHFIADMKTKNDELTARIIDLEINIAQKITPSMEQILKFFHANRENIEEIPYMQEESGKSSEELQRLISDNQKMMADIKATNVVAKEAVRQINISEETKIENISALVDSKNAENMASNMALQEKLSVQLLRATQLNAKTNFETNCAKLVVYGIPDGRSLALDVRTAFGEEIQGLIGDTCSDARRMRPKGAATSDKPFPILIEFKTPRLMRECRAKMRQALSQSREREASRAIRLEEYIPAPLLPKKNELHRLANLYKSRFPDVIRIFRVNMSTRHFDLRVYIRLHDALEKTNKEEGFTLTWGELDEDDLRGLRMFDQEIFRFRQAVEQEDFMRPVAPQPTSRPPIVSTHPPSLPPYSLTPPPQQMSGPKAPGPLASPPTSTDFPPLTSTTSTVTGAASDIFRSTTSQPKSSLAGDGTTSTYTYGNVDPKPQREASSVPKTVRLQPRATDLADSRRNLEKDFESDKSQVGMNLEGSWSAAVVRQPGNMKEFSSKVKSTVDSVNRTVETVEDMTPTSKTVTRRTHKVMQQTIPEVLEVAFSEMSPRERKRLAKKDRRGVVSLKRSARSKTGSLMHEISDQEDST